MGRRRTAAAVAAAALGSMLLLAACSSGAANSGQSSASGSPKAYNLWYINPLPSFQAWGQSNKYFKDAANTLGYKATLVGPNAIDIPSMVNDFDQAMADHADGILTCSLDPAAFKAPIAKAKAAGTGVVSIGCVDPSADYSIGTDNLAYGKTSADLIAAGAGQDATVAILGTAKTTPNQVAQVAGFNAQIKAKYPNMKVVTWESDDSDPAKATTKIEAIIAAYPHLKALWMIEGAAPGAAPTALTEAGKKPGDLFVLGIDDLAPTLKAVEKGWITTTLAQCYFQASPFGAQLLIAKKQGKGPTKTFWPVPVEPVTKATLPWKGCPASDIPHL
ncbi:MAG: hypothetical protein JWO57_3435 [Pseudonocardiales bacterium]|nr:hypothetical protein [Pseudonocardiales bacterium]